MGLPVATLACATQFINQSSRGEALNASTRTSLHSSWRSVSICLEGPRWERLRTRGTLVCKHRSRCTFRDRCKAEVQLNTQPRPFLDEYSHMGKRPRTRYPWCRCTARRLRRAFSPPLKRGECTLLTTEAMTLVTVIREIEVKFQSIQLLHPISSRNRERLGIVTVRLFISISLSPCKRPKLREISSRTVPRRVASCSLFSFN